MELALEQIQRFGEEVVTPIHKKYPAPEPSRDPSGLPLVGGQIWDAPSRATTRSAGAAPEYTVDDRGKVVGGYSPREPNNWGRWGEEDQRGTQNLIGPEQRVAAAQLVQDRQDVLAGASAQRRRAGLAAAAGAPAPGAR